MQDYFLEVAIPTPLSRRFDYLPPDSTPTPNIVKGARVRVPFGRRQLVGVVTDIKSSTNIPKNKLKASLELLDPEPIFTQDLMQLLCWASQYYHHPLGEVFATALPKWLREGRLLNQLAEPVYALTPKGESALTSGITRAKKQAALLAYVHSHAAPSKTELQTRGFLSTIVKAVVDKGWLKVKKLKPTAWEQLPVLKQAGLTLNQEQQQAVQAITSTHHFTTYLLEGVTGSGKTEVYLQTIEACLKAGKQALVLIPEISLTPQTLARFEARFGVPIGALHSRMSDGERARTWSRAKNNDVAIVIGTRSAVFTPMPKLGLIVMDEEHDGSFIQQSGFRYSAREIAIMRAKNKNIPIVLGTATPSLQTLANAKAKRFTKLSLPKRAIAQLPAKYELVNLCSEKLTAGLTPYALSKIKSHLDQKHQVMVFINRRGFAPTLLCHHCGWSLDCPDCDTHMTWHESQKRAICHHCGRRQRVAKLCPDCQQSDLSALGIGTEQIDDMLCTEFPAHAVMRIDRDTMSQKNSFTNMLAQVNRGEVDILVGTQMLAKGHHFPNLMLVVVVNSDSQLYSADFQALEQLGQLLVQVCGRAGREIGQGEVLIQTHQPKHPLLNCLLHKGYSAFANQLLKERKESGLPPYAYLAKWHVASKQVGDALNFLNALRDQLKRISDAEIVILGPIPAIMERRAGKYQFELIALAQKRPDLQTLLDKACPIVETLQKPRGLSFYLTLT